MSGTPSGSSSSVSPASVVRACQRILGDRHEAEDAAQEAFVTAYRSLASWRGEGTFGAWVARIAVRIALRQASRRRTVTWIDPVGDGDAGSAGVAGLAPDPALLALRAERTVAIREAVARLDEPYRETVALRFFAERSLAEIADQTGRPLGTVKTHLHRGLQRLRDGARRAGGRAVIERRPPFGPDELPESELAPDLATSVAMGRAVEAAASEAVAPPGRDFTTRVMAAIALEPVPQPTTVAGRALRGGRPWAFLAALGDAWRVALGGGRPAAIRLQALALVLVAVVAIGSVLSVGGAAVVGALGLLDGKSPSPTVPLPSPLPSPTPTPAPSVAPSLTSSPSPGPTITPTPTATPGATGTDEPGETGEPEGTDDSGGSSGRGSGELRERLRQFRAGLGRMMPPGGQSAVRARVVARTGWARVAAAGRR